MMEEEPAADMVRETYRIVREAMDAGVADNVIPAAVLMQVMMYGIRSGEHVVVRVEGPDEVTAAEALRKIMATF